jgi:antitoxin CcdA
MDREPFGATDFVLEGMRMDDADKVLVQIAVDRRLAEEARTSGLDLEEVAEAALRRRLGRPNAESGQAERIEQWRREHAEAIACHNEIVDREGVFGEEWRTF